MDSEHGSSFGRSTAKAVTFCIVLVPDHRYSVTLATVCHRDRAKTWYVGDALLWI
jgi:hypothetical protein